MLILVEGEDIWRVGEKYRELRTAFAKKHDPDGYNTALFPGVLGETWSWGEVLQTACTLPFLASHRFVGVEEILRTTPPADLELCKARFATLPETTVLVMTTTLSEGMRKRHSLYKALAELKETHRYTFAPMRFEEAVAWVIERAQRLQKRLAQAEARLLVDRVGIDASSLASELEKLVSSTPTEEIPRSLIETLVCRRVESEMFTFLDALIHSAPSRLLHERAKERAAGTDDHLLFSLLIRQLRLLLQASSLASQNAPQEVWKETLGLPSFVLTKMQKTAHIVPFSRLKQWHAKALELDASLKHGERDAADVVDELICLVSQQKTSP